MPAVLNAIFERHRRSLLWSVMRIVRDPQAAEDLTQETYLRARGAAETGSIEHLEGFLHHTARNLALDHLRRKGVRESVETSAMDDGVVQEIPADIPSIEQAMIEKQRFRLFKEALSGLPKRAQEVMMLSKVDGWSHPKIAEHLGVSERTVFNDLKLAMSHCREALARRDSK